MLVKDTKSFPHQNQREFSTCVNLREETLKETILVTGTTVAYIVIWFANVCVKPTHTLKEKTHAFVVTKVHQHITLAKNIAIIYTLFVPITNSFFQWHHRGSRTGGGCFFSRWSDEYRDEGGGFGKRGAWTDDSRQKYELAPRASREGIKWSNRSNPNVVGLPSKVRCC